MSETKPGAPGQMFKELEERAEHLRAFGYPDQARAVLETLRQATSAMEDWWNQPLSIAEAAALGGYSPGRLRALVKEGTILVAPSGGIRRRHVPVHPGHALPLPFIPEVAGRPDIVSEIHHHRESKSA